MAFDFKKEFNELYNSADTPHIVNVPQIKYVAVKGTGNPNEKDGEYSKAVGLLYAVAYTIKMSKLSKDKIDGYFDFVVPPLEGLWWMSDNTAGIDYSRKQDFAWISMIQLPPFVTLEVFEKVKQQAAQKKKIDTSKAELFIYDEGLCVQCMHHGSFDDEPKTIEMLDSFNKENGYTNDMNSGRFHHEIYLADPRKVATEKLRTIIRHPIK